MWARSASGTKEPDERLRGKATGGMIMTDHHPQSIRRVAYTLALAGFFIALTVDMADARRHGRHHRYSFPRYSIERIVPAPESFARAPVEARGFDRRPARDEIAAL